MQAVVLVEGEKSADALIGRRIAATTAMSGAYARPKDTDWSPLAGKTVIVWPDNDKPSSDYADKISPVLASLGCTVLRVTPPADAKTGWDAADCIRDARDPQELIDAAQPVEIKDKTFAFYDELSDPPPKQWIMKNVMARGETSNWFGPPASLKSALLLDLAVHVAAKKDWRGHRAKERCGVLYLALERFVQAKRRLATYKTKRNAGADLPVAIKSGIIDLMRSDCVEQIIDSVRKVEAHFGCPVGLIVIDTISKGIAAGGGDEDKAMHTNIMLANLRRIEEQTNVHIACIGHTGKDESRGHRGSNAHKGDVELMVQITSGGAVKTATIIKANDQEEGHLTHYKGEIISLGTDEDGDEQTVMLIAEETVTAGDEGKAKRRLSALQSRALELLTRCINDLGKPPPPSNDYPQNIRVVTIKQWHAMCERGELSSAENKKDRDKAFRRAKDELQTLHRIACLDGNVWSVIDFNLDTTK